MAALSVLLATTAAAQVTVPSVVKQYSADWSDSPGFQPAGPLWDPGASAHVVFQSLTPDLITAITSSNTNDTQAFYQRYFQGTLRRWSNLELNKNVHGQALVADAVDFFDETFERVGPQLQRRFPGYPRDVYKALTLENLVHGYHVYASSGYYETITGQVPGHYTVPILQSGQLTMADEFESLLEAPVADCGEIAEMVRVAGRLWGLDMRYLGIQLDFLSPRANAEVQSTHAFDILVYTDKSTGKKTALFTDAVTNIAIAAGPVNALLPAEMSGDGIIASDDTAADRYAALSASGRILRSFNVFMNPPVREGYLKTVLPDASLTSFMYVYYLEAYPNALHTYGPNSHGWGVVNTSWSLNQPHF